MQFDILKTNITKVTADAIVLPANEHLKEGSGTSTAIFEAAGRTNLTQACKKIGHCDIGNAVPTPAFNLNAKFVIHAVAPCWVDGEHGEYNMLSSAYLTALNLADAMGCESIAFPVLSSGNNGFDKELAIHIAKESFEHFSGSHLKHIMLIIYGDSMEELVKSLGYSISSTPSYFQYDEQKFKHKKRIRKLFGEGKDIAQQIILDQIEKGLEWLKDKENLEKVLQYACVVVKLAFDLKKSTRK